MNTESVVVEDISNLNLINNNNNEKIISDDTTRAVAPNLTFPPQTNTTLFNYTLVKLLKSDNYCAVFDAHFNDVMNEKFIAKIAIGANTGMKSLAREVNNYKLLEGVQFIPKLFFYKTWIVDEENDWLEKNWSMIIIEKLGTDLEEYLNNFCERKIPIKRLLPLAVQQISLLESIHDKGLIHRGVKPDNFVLAHNNDSIVYLIDFNHSKRYINRDKKHIKFQSDDKLPKGNVLFHSLNYHNGIRRTRRDDLESLGICWVYMLKRKLPWSDIKRTIYPITDYYEYIRIVGDCVRNTSIDEICKDLPPIFDSYLKMCRQLKYDERPDYENMRNLLNDYNEKINRE